MGSELANLIDKRFSSSFKFSFAVLPRDQREAIVTVYKFCRATDDIVDGNFELSKKHQYLKKWTQELGKALEGNSQYSFLNKLAEIAKKFNIPIQHFFDLISGVEMDLYKNRYNTFSELEKYCRLVASSVGLMVVKIFAPDNERIIKYAENLGIALQLTNILRDIKSDLKLNRIYLPLEDMQRYDYSEENLLQQVYNENFIKLMEYETKRVEDYYEAARNALSDDDKLYLLAPKIMERIYYRTLQKIKKNNYNVFKKSIRIASPLKMLIAIKYYIMFRIFKKI